MPFLASPFWFDAITVALSVISFSTEQHCLFIVIGASFATTQRNTIAISVATEIRKKATQLFSYLDLAQLSLLSGQLSLLPSLEREMNTDQNAVMLCSSEVKAGMTRSIHGFTCGWQVKHVICS